jgi:hypothetical protein
MPKIDEDLLITTPKKSSKKITQTLFKHLKELMPSK